MNEQGMKIWTRVKETANKLTKKQKTMLGSLLAVVLLFSAGMAVYLNNKPYETLFTGVNEQESSEIIGKLQESGVDYKYTNQGSILVPRDQVERLRIQLVSEGYPKSGFTYDVFKSNIDLMTTDFEKNKYDIFDLQNRIAATICLFDGVKDAKVTLALGENKKYVLDDNTTQATASVVVIMKNGGSPSEEQVQGIQTLVARSIPGLEFDSIGVVDGNGKDVTLDGNSASGASKRKLEMEREVEDSVRAKLMNVLTPIFGDENVKVEVKSSVDMDKVIQENVAYTPNVNNRGVPSRESMSQEYAKNGEIAGGVPGTENNADTADLPNYTEIEGDGTENYVRTTNDTEYYVDTQKQQVQREAGIITDLSVSVALNNVQLNARQLTEIRTLIARTAGIEIALENDKIAIVNLPFYQDPEAVEENPEEEEEQTNWILIAAIGAGVFVLFLLILILALAGRKKKKKRRGAAEPSRVPYAPPEPQADAPPAKGLDSGKIGSELLNIKNERSMELREEIRDFADENPEIAASLLKQWLRGGEQNG